MNTNFAQNNSLYAGGSNDFFMMATQNPQFTGNYGNAILEDPKISSYAAAAKKTPYCSRTTIVISLVIFFVVAAAGGVGAAVFLTGAINAKLDENGISNSTKTLTPSTAPSNIDLNATASPTILATNPATTTKSPTKAAEGTRSPTTIAPTIATTAPTVATKNPTVATNAPTVATKTPTVATKNPTIATNAPTIVTKAPTVATKAPTVATKAPTVATKAPTVATKAPTVAVTNAPTVTGTSAERFDIQLVFLSELTPQETAAFTAAKARWEEVITADLGATQALIRAGDTICDQTSSTDILIDDIIIFVKVAFIDGVNGVLGRAGPCALVGGQVRGGVMTFDSADTASMVSQGTLGSVILHEMGHVLGIGTRWDAKGLISPPSVTTNIKYLGANGNAGHVAIGGTGQADIEDTGGQGTARGHWKESVYQNELMTGFISGSTQPMSQLTVRSLQDLGYTVDASKADFFVKPSSSGRRLREPGFHMGPDMYTGPVVELTEVFPKPGREEEFEQEQAARKSAGLI